MVQEESVGPERCPDERSRRAAARLAAKIGASRIIDDDDLLAGFAGDESRLTAVLPAAVVRARGVDDVRATLEIAQELDRQLGLNETVLRTKLLRPEA